MLTPDYLNGCPDDVVELYAKLDESITRDVARRLVKTGGITESAKWQAEMAQQSGLLYDEVIQSVSDISGASESAVKAVFEDAGIESTTFDNSVYEAAGLSPKPLNLSPSSMNVLKAGLAKTNGLIGNLTNTTALQAQDAYINACTLAEMQIESGAFDYNTAIKNAVDDAIEQGSTVRYPSGHIDTLETAVRRSVMTGVSQTAGEISVANANDMGCDLMEITAHGGARPSHAAWQGKIVSLSGAKGYLSQSDIGYGSGGGFKGYNCRHDWYPFFEGLSKRAYSDKELKSLNDKTVEYNGKEYSQYEAEQLQRGMERSVRKSKQRLAGYDEAAKNAPNAKLKDEFEMDFYAESQKLKAKKFKYGEFCEKTGLPSDNARMQQRGYNRSVSGKAVAANKKFDFIKNDVIIKSSGELPPRFDIPGLKLKHTVNVSIDGGRGKLVSGLNGVVPKGVSLSDAYVMAGKGTSTPIRDLSRLSKTYNLSPQGWRKVSATAYSNNFRYTLHWYEHYGTIPIDEIKLKGVGAK